MSKRKLVIAGLLASLSWAGASYIRLLAGRRYGIMFFTALGWQRGWQNIGPTLIWTLGGLGTALALGYALPALRKRHIAAIALAWALGGSLIFRVENAVTYALLPHLPLRIVHTVDAGITIGPLLCGFLTGLVLRRGYPPANWLQVGAVTLGWGLSFIFIPEITPGMLFGSRVLGLVGGMTLAGMAGVSMTLVALSLPAANEESLWFATRRDNGHVHLRHNPLYLQLVNRPLWAAERRVGLVFAILLTGVLGGVYQITLAANALGPGDLSLVAISGLMLLAAGAVLPLFLALVAAAQTGQHAYAERLHLLRVTTLSEHDLVWGFVGAALHRLRLLLLLSVALTPLAMVAVLSRFAELYRWLPFPTPVQIPGQSPPVGGAVLAAGALAIGLVGMNWLAAALGVALALRWPRRAQALAAPAAMLLFLGLMLAIAAGSYTLLPAEWVARAIGLGFFALAPYVVGVEVLDGAQRQVRGLAR